MVSDLIQPSHQSTTIARTALKKKNKNRTFEWWWAQTGGKDPNSLGATWLPLPRIPLTMFGPLFFSFFFFSFFFYRLFPFPVFPGPVQTFGPCWATIFELKGPEWPGLPELCRAEWRPTERPV